MLTESPSPRLDLLVVGGLTVDGFADGSSAPGGSVLHIARALAGRAGRLGIVTVAGPEPEAQAGLAELRDLVTMVDCRPAAKTAAFRHRETAAGRRLWLDRGGAAIRPARAGQSPPRPKAVLFAPIAAEVGPAVLGRWASVRPRGAILQGWLRRRGEGGAVEPLAPEAVDERVVDLLRQLDLLVGSREDLAADGPGAPDQLAALRRRFGARPALVLTAGADGAWLDLAEGLRQRATWHLAAPRRVDGAPTVGAGDVLAAAMLIGEWPPEVPGRSFLSARAAAAMGLVADVLEARVRS